MDWTKLIPEGVVGPVLLSDLAHGQFSAWLAANPRAALAIAFLYAVLNKLLQSPRPAPPAGPPTVLSS